MGNKNRQFVNDRMRELIRKSPAIIADKQYVKLFYCAIGKSLIVTTFIKIHRLHFTGGILHLRDETIDSSIDVV